MSLTSGNWDSFDTTVNSLFDNFIKDLNVARGSNVRRGRVPALDVHETEKEFIVNAELPGLNKDEINVDIRDNTLIISGETKKDEKFKEGNTLVQERRYGSFTRGISLPPNVKGDDVIAKFENGVLEMKLPKSEPSGKKIKIQ
ncbi:HSP20-like chaperone [Glomus cerebriforme]|uniref:HSP20-like chaperone n=1 Tax=Glomus cerebriforme TaxID=658196 RepID=A0A397S950_9GLOM|nr:HSP20-like chaperone [Glomus cerebriforme]